MSRKTATLLITNTGNKVVEIDPSFLHQQMLNAVPATENSTKYTLIAENGYIKAIIKEIRSPEQGYVYTHDQACDNDTTFEIEGVVVSGTKHINEQKTPNKWVNCLLMALI